MRRIEIVIMASLMLFGSAYAQKDQKKQQKTTTEMEQRDLGPLKYLTIYKVRHLF
jgi:hypothetical protein